MSRTVQTNGRTHKSCTPYLQHLAYKLDDLRAGRAVTLAVWQLPREVRHHLSGLDMFDRVRIDRRGRITRERHLEAVDDHEGGWFADQIRDLQRQITELRAARTLEAATIGQGGLNVIGGSIVITDGGAIVIQDSSGNEVARFDATSLDVAGQLTVDGTLDVTGSAVISGTLSLPAGIIGNAALAAPVVPATFNNSVSGQTWTGTYASRTSASVAVPSGYSRALVTAIAIAGCSTGAAASLLGAYADVNGSSGDTQATTCAPSSSMTVTAAFATLVTGLSGGSVTVSAFGAAGSAASSSCDAHISGIAVFLR